MTKHTNRDWSDYIIVKAAFWFVIGLHAYGLLVWPQGMVMYLLGHGACRYVMRKSK